MNAEELWVPWGYDMHIHLRMGEVLKAVVWFSANSFYGGLIMPNTDPKILTGADAVRYFNQIRAICPGFKAGMTIYLTAQTTPKMILEAKETGVVWAGKLFPAGVTTGSDEGVSDFQVLYPAFETMEKIGMILSIHGQLPGKNIFFLDREEKFLPVLVQTAKDFPRLRIVIEHLSTKAAVQTVLNLGDNVAATITIQHMVLTANDFADGALRPDNFCIPPPQRLEDRDALRRAAMSGNPKFFCANDSAPHVSPKLKGGVFSAPVAKQALVQLFERHAQERMLAGFMAEFGPRFYGLPKGREQEMRKMVRRDWTVPASYPCGNDVIVPFMAGETLHWQVAD